MFRQLFPRMTWQNIATEWFYKVAALFGLHFSPIPIANRVFVRMELKGRIVVYSIVGCPHCMKAKNSLQELGLPYSDVSLDSFPQVREYVKERTGRQTVPQIFFNSIHVGGNDDLQKAIKDEGEWKKLVDEVKNNELDQMGGPPVPDPADAVPAKGVSGFVCEPDEYAQLVAELKASGIIRDHRAGLTVHKNSFSGKDFVQWVMKEKQFDHSKAIEMGQALIDQHFGHNVKKDETFKDDSVYYRLLEDDESTALNAGPTSECQPRPAGELAEDIRRLILKLYGAFLSPDGKKVNYSGIGGSSEFGLYQKLVKELIRLDLKSISRQEKLAFFINIYNALVIHANIVRGPPVNLWQRYKFFNTVRYIIGGHEYSLQDIENGVLRANRKGVGMLSRPFGRGDPRLAVALAEPEPLIHFALVCGAKSCPPIKTYSAQEVDEQLRVAAEAFLEGDDALSVNMERKEVRLSQILKWYRVDFGSSNEEVLRWVHDHMAAGDKKNQLGELLQGKNFKLSYFNYDWGINS